jgi:hypothetical protein
MIKTVLGRIVGDAADGIDPDQVSMEYTPTPDGRPDPGEIVWTWVAYEDDPSLGKDRPVLLVARAGEVLVGLMLTSQDHDRDAADEASFGRYWVDIGSGPWDAQGRPSEVRVDRPRPRQVRPGRRRRARAPVRPAETGADSWQ